MSIDNLLKGILTPVFVFGILRSSTPIILAALGGLIPKKGGALNIGLEGMMLVSAFTGVAISASTNSAWIGLLAGIGAAILIGLIIGFAHINLGVNIIVAGIAINLLASGLTVFLLYELTGDKGFSSSLLSGVLPSINIPLIKDIPIINQMFNGHNVITYIAFLAMIFTWWLLYKTPFGAHIRATGENEAAAISVGINVKRVKYITLIICGVLCGLGGAFLSMGYLNMFSKDMTAGRGFMALAAITLGGSTPGGSVIASLLFGSVTSFSIQIGTINIPSEIPKMIPYLATLISLVIYNKYRMDH